MHSCVFTSVCSQSTKSHVRQAARSAPNLMFVKPQDPDQVSCSSSCKIRTKSHVRQAARSARIATQDDSCEEAFGLSAHVSHYVASVKTNPRLATRSANTHS
eukprot:6177404-Pleurochrysis_carterae.AAC.2